MIFKPSTFQRGYHSEADLMKARMMRTRKVAARMISVFSSRPRPCDADVIPSNPDMSSEPPRPPRLSDLSSLSKEVVVNTTEEHLMLVSKTYSRDI